MVQTIILHHTLTDANQPALLYAGEAAVGAGPTFTRLWAGDGTVNRLLLSNNPLDTPLFSVGIPEAPGGPGIFGRNSVTGWQPALPLVGGTMLGALTLQADAATALQPVTLQQMTAGLGAYLPLAGGTLSGTLTVGLNNSPNAWLVLNGTAAANKGIYWDVGGSDRWGLYSSGAETGGNAGSGLTLTYNNDAGFTAGYIFTASRTGSGINFQSAVTLDDALTVDGTATVLTGLSMGTTVAASGTDLSRGISVLSPGYGFCVTSAQMHYTVPAGALHVFGTGGATLAWFAADGINVQPGCFLFGNLAPAANDADAAAAGVPVGAMYNNGGVVHVRQT